MGWLEEHVQHLSPPQTVVHIGAGLCGELHAWRRSGADRIILVEPNPDYQAKLRDCSAGDSRIAVAACAIAEQAGEAPFFVLNRPDLSSLRAPLAPTSLVPDLAVAGEHLVATQRFEALVADLSPEREAENWLFIDVPGEEATVLAGLEAGNGAGQFDRVFLRSPCSALHEGARPADELMAWLARIGYDLEGSIDLTEPDWPRYQLRLNPKALECRALLDEKQQLEEALRVRMEEAKASEEARAQTLTEERDALKNEVEAVTMRAEKQLEEARAAWEAEAQAQQQTIESLEKELAAAREEARQSRSDASLAIRVQRLRESDLEELQQRYAQLREVNDRQRQLLDKLYQRLSAAAEFLKHSKDTPGAQIAERAELVDALTGQRRPVGEAADQEGKA